MKTVTWMIAGIALTLSSPQVGWTGDKAHGGDSCSQRMPILQTKLLETVKKQGASAYPEFEEAVLKHFINRATISVDDDLTVDGKQVDARSWPGKYLIEVDRKRFCENEERFQLSILFHEYLILMGLEASNEYGISNRLLVFFEKTSSSDGINQQTKTQPVNPKKYTCVLDFYYLHRMPASFQPTTVEGPISLASFGSTRELAWSTRPTIGSAKRKLMKSGIIAHYTEACNRIKIETENSAYIPDETFRCIEKPSEYKNCWINE